MSGLFSSNRPPAGAQYPMGQQITRVNTNQQARVVPLLYGTNRLGVTFISDTFDLLSTAVNTSVGKTNTTTGNNYFASFAALVCHGPVDGLYDIYLNGDPVYVNNAVLYCVALSAAGVSGDEFYTATFQTAGPHGLATGDVVVITGCFDPEFNGEYTVTVVSATQFQYQMSPTDVTDEFARSYTAGDVIYAQVRLDPVLRDDDNPDWADITIPGYGVMRIYWGTETQTPDEYLIAASGQQHPAYLGLCYVVFTQLFFGFNQTNVPNVEFILRRGPVPDFGAQPSALNGDANPAYVFADLLQNPRAGLALADSFLDTAAIEAAAAQFTTESFGVAQVISRDTDVRSTLSTLCDTVDMLPVLDACGLLSLVAIRDPGDKVLQIVDDQLADLPVFTPQDWSTTYSQVRFVFNDETLFYQDNALTWRDIGMLNVVRNPSILNLDRKWITNETLANLAMQAAGQQNAIPLTTGKIKLRWDPDLFAALSPGSVFALSLVFRDTGANLWRVTTRSVPDPGVPEFEVEFQTDRTYLYDILEPGGAGNPAPVGPEPEADIAGGSPAPPPPVVVAPYTRFAMIELPPALCPGQPAIAAVVARNASTVTSFSVWVKKNYAWSGAPPESYLGPSSFTRFAFHGSLISSYPCGTRNIDLQLGASIQLDGPDQSLPEISAFEALADTLLAFIDQEILSLAGWTLINPGYYNCNFIRGRFGSPIQSHAAGAQVLLINRADLAIISSASFKPDCAQVLQFAFGNQGLANATEADLTIAGAAWRVPAPSALTVNGRFRNAIFPGGATPLNIAWVLPEARGLFASPDPANLVTRLKFYLGATADSGSITADTTLLTADGGSLTLEDGDLVETIDVAWPATSEEVTFDTFAADQNFLLVASTVNKLPLKEVASAAVQAVPVLKYP